MNSLLESGLLQLGDAGELGPNASVMLRIATLSAWAELEIFTETQQYLVNVVAPYRRALASLWIGSLRDYASIKAGTELLDDSSTGAVDTSYSSLGKEVLLPVRHSSNLFFDPNSHCIVLPRFLVRHHTGCNELYGTGRSVHTDCTRWRRPTYYGTRCYER